MLSHKTYHSPMLTASGIQIQETSEEELNYCSAEGKDAVADQVGLPVPPFR